jgi:hypothetical protein
MPTALPLLLAMLTSTTPAPLSVELVPPLLFRPLPGKAILRYVATREIPFLTTSFKWDLLGRRTFFEPHKKRVEVPLRLQGGVLRADRLEREAGGLSRWTLMSVEVQYGPYAFCYDRSSLQEGLPLWEHPQRLDVLVPSGPNHLDDKIELLRIVPSGGAPAPDVARLPVNQSGLAEVVLVPGVELEPALRDAFLGQDWATRLHDTAFRLEAVLVEERDLPPAHPLPQEAEQTEPAWAPSPTRRAELTREQWEALRAHPAERPGLSVRWEFVEKPDKARRTRLALTADGEFEPVVLLVTTFIDAQRAVRPAAIRLVPGKAAPAQGIQEAP